MLLERTPQERKPTLDEVISRVDGHLAQREEAIRHSSARPEDVLPLLGLTDDRPSSEPPIIFDPNHPFPEPLSENKRK